MIKVDNRQMVVPSQVLGDGQKRAGDNTYLSGDRLVATVMGQARVNNNRLRVVPYDGPYTAKVDDVVIGVVFRTLTGKWLIDVNAPGICIMMGEEATRQPLNEDLNRFFAPGDRLSLRISKVNEIGESVGIRPWKLEGGRIITIKPRRVPRVVGRQRSMLEIIKAKTNAKIVVGQNGRIWLKGGDIGAAVAAIRTIERLAHTSGLTDRITTMLG